MSEGSNVASTSSYVFPAAPGPAGPMGDTFTGETSSAAAAATAGVSPSAADVVFDNDARHPNFFKLHQEQLEARRAHAEIQKAKLSAVRLSKKDAKGISGGRLKRYMCTWPDCGKAYTRPTRLAEHQRTHTGERPYPCLYCAATFSRESHRKAHTRIHRDDSERNCYCPVEGCGMVFWTNQHLKKHMEGKHGDPKPPKYFCTQCDEGFRQRKMLRTHTMEVHGPPDAKPYPCMHPGCDKTFSQFAHVRSHMKTHDLSRYACIHPDCAGLGDEANQFGTWSALQKHTKAMHPPVCPHEECNGRTFTTRRGLRYHLDSHTRKQQRAEARMARDALTAAMYGRTADDVPEDEHDGHFASTSAAAKRVAPFAAGAGSPKTRKKAKPNYAENSDDDGPTFDDLYGDDAGFSPAAPEQEDEDDNFRSDMGDSDDEIEEGVVWLAQQDAERDDRMREDFRHGGKRKRKVLREADGFPPLLLPIPPPPLARRDASPPLERLPTPPPNIMGTPLVIPDQAPQQSLYLDLVTGANYSPATSVSPPPVPPAASNSGAAEPSAPLEDQAAADAAPVTKARPLLARKFPCPYPAILSLPHTSLRPVPQEGEEPKKKQKRQRARFPFRTPLPEGMEPIEGMSADDDESDAEDGDGLCKFWFKRVYDVERHLKSKHKIVLEGGRTPLNVWFASETTAETPIATQ